MEIKVQLDDKQTGIEIAGLFDNISYEEKTELRKHIMTEYLKWYIKTKTDTDGRVRYYNRSDSNIMDKIANEFPSVADGVFETMVQENEELKKIFEESVTAALEILPDIIIATMTKAVFATMTTPHNQAINTEQHMMRMNQSAFQLRDVLFRKGILTGNDGVTL